MIESINVSGGFEIEMERSRIVITPLSEVGDAYLKNTLKLDLARSLNDRSIAHPRGDFEPYEIVRSPANWVTWLLGNLMGSAIVVFIFWLLS
jgi:hypothetical protein